MAFVQLSCAIFFSALIPLVFGICDNYPTTQEYFNSRPVQRASEKDLATFVQYEKFTIPLEADKCQAEVTANPNYKHAFSKYSSWTEEEGVDDSVMHHGCTCKEVIAIFDFAKDTKPNHLMCRQTEMYATFCDGFQKDDKFKEKSEALLAALKDVDSDILEYIFHDGAQLVRQYLTNKEVKDTQWPLAQTLAYIKTQKDAFAGQVGGIVAAAVERKEIEAYDKAAAETRIVQVHTSTVANIVSHTMDLGLQLQTAQAIVGEVNFNSLTYKGKLLGLEAVVKNPTARAYVMSDAGKLPKFLELISVIILPLSIVPLDGLNEIQIEVKKFVASFFEDVSAKQGWEMESSLLSLSTYCKMTLKDIKTILAEQKKAAEEAAKKRKEAEARLAAEREEEAKAEEARRKAAEEKEKAKAAGENGSGGEQAEKKEDKSPPASEQKGDGNNNGQQQQAATTQAQQEQKEPSVQHLGGGRIATTQAVEEDRITPEQKKIAEFLKSFKALNDKAALELYIKEHAADSEETLKVDRNEHFVKEVTLTCSYK